MKKLLIVGFFMFQAAYASDVSKPVVELDREQLIEQIKVLQLINADLKAQLVAQSSLILETKKDDTGSNCTEALSAAFRISAATGPK